MPSPAAPTPGRPDVPGHPVAWRDRQGLTVVQKQALGGPGSSRMGGVGGYTETAFEGRRRWEPRQGPACTGPGLLSEVISSDFCFWVTSLLCSDAKAGSHGLTACRARAVFTAGGASF